MIGSYYSGQKTKEYLESEEEKKDWNKFEENLKEEWEAKKNKGIAYAGFYQTSLEAFLTAKVGIKDIVIGTGKSIDDTLTFPDSTPIELPTHTGNTDTLPEKTPILPPTSLNDGKELKGPIVDPLPEVQDKNDLTTADKNPPKLNNNHIYFITAEGTLEVKNTDMPKDYTLNEDGTVVGPKGGEYKQAGYTEDGKVIFANNKEFFLFEGGEKKAVSSPETGGIIQTGLTRPPLTKATKDKIKERYIDNKDGTFTHKLTGKKIIGPIDYGHIYSWENRRLIKAAESLGMDQKTFNQYVNSRDNIFQLENHYENVSHENEKPGNSLEKDIVEDMQNYLKELNK
ncbi:MAG: GH-E family nuclease [Fusobacterium varium]|nr:GH-E family nuclease [Fusobacterium varium]